MNAVGNFQTPAIFGQRAFYKLPPAARGPAATALFAWAKAYVSSPAFAASYAEFRRNANPVDTAATPDVDAAVKAQIDEMLAGVDEWKKVAATLKPVDQARMQARRLREFLDATADVNFAARTIHLSGGADGIELVDPADRERPWMWQAAAIVGPEATGAARAAATAWLAELGR